MEKRGKQKSQIINFINLYVEDEMEYMDENYVEANQRLQKLDDEKYLATFYLKELDYKFA